MYSHGSSARVGVGRRGHGGRNYRPPKERNKDPSVLVPPPLKACDCMVQLDVPEYAVIAPEIPGENQQEQQRSRLHLCFEGSNRNERKQSLVSTEKTLRSRFGVHLVVPGRNQTGPLAVVGKSIQQTLPAVDYLMNQLVLEPERSNDGYSSVSFLKGRIMRNVKDQNDVVLHGRFLQQIQQQSLSTTNENNTSKNGSISLQPYWLFESESWNAMVCPLSLPETAGCVAPASSSTTSSNSTTTTVTSRDEATDSGEQHQLRQDAIAEALQISFDNLRFRIGNASLSELHIFLHSFSAPPPPTTTTTTTSKDTSPLAMRAPRQKAFATGDPSGACIHELFREIQQTEVVLP